jgi:hypothetical protein
LDETKIRKRIADIQEYIDNMAILSAAAPTEEIKSRSLNYWGFAMMIKELFELHLTKSVAMTQEEINKERRGKRLQIG